VPHLRKRMLGEFQRRNYSESTARCYPQTYLFPGTVNGWRAEVPISANAVWLACRQTAKAAGITKPLSPHTPQLRHPSPGSRS
jgi:site-specific recombinase XerD